MSRPPVATERLALTAKGHVRYRLKTPYRDGTTQIVPGPLDLMARRTICSRRHSARRSDVILPSRLVTAGFIDLHGAATTRHRHGFVELEA